ncbi:MAG: F0F1 ATP synthase subunit delta [Clostridia bacterium]|nr:F0F1 ATP synthase subunit delta [Clostridia bacterium]
MAGLISKRYAEALFQLALEQNCVDKYSDEIKLMYDTLTSDSEILRVLNHPQISSDKKLDILITAFKDSVDENIIGLLSIVFRKNREKELTDILNTFLNKVLDYKGIITATVESAVTLKENKLNEIKEKLSSKLNKQVEIEAKVVPELIGGLKITVGGRVIDNTVKSQLDAIKKTLLDARLA